MADEWDEFEDAPQQQGAEPEEASDGAADPWGEFADAPRQRAPAAAPAAAAPPVWTGPSQVERVKAAAAAAPKDTRKVSQLLGAAKGGAGLVDRFWQRVGSIPGVDNYLSDPRRLASGNPFEMAAGGAYQGEKALIRDRALPAIAKAEKTTRPGGIGKFLGETLVTLPAGGPITQGAISGFANSDAKMGDWSPDALRQLAFDTGVGGVTGKVGDVVGGKVARAVGDRVIAGATKFRPDKAIPALAAAKDAAYQKVRDLGVVYKPEAVQRLEQSMMKTMHDFGANPTAHGPAFAKLRQLTDRVEGLPVNTVGPHGPRQPTTPLPITLGEVDALRREIFEDVVDVGSRESAALGRKMAKQLDQFIDTAAPNDIAVPGQQGMARDASVAMAAAREANKKYRNVELIDRKLRGAESKAKRVYRGGGLDNKIRQVMGPLADPDSPRNIERFLHPEAYAALQKTVEGSPLRDTLRTLGTFTPFSLKGAIAGKFTGGSSAVVGFAAKYLANKATRKSVSDLMEMIASGGTKKAMLAERQLRALAARNSSVGKFLTAVEKDAGELAGQGANQGQQKARRDARAAG